MQIILVRASGSHHQSGISITSISGGMMNQILTVLISFLTLLSINSCGPRDVHSQSLKERILGGEVIIYKNSGDRSPTCFKDLDDWQDLRIHENDYENFILGKFQSFMQNGYKNCHRVGNRVYVKNQ